MKYLLNGVAASVLGMMGLNRPFIDEAHNIGRNTPRKKKSHLKPEPYKAQVHYHHPDPLQRALRKMTNWQHNQAGKKCKGNFRSLNQEQLDYYCNLKKTA